MPTVRRTRPGTLPVLVLLTLVLGTGAGRPAPADAAVPRVTTPGFKGSTKRLAARPTTAAAKPSAPLVLAGAGRHPHSVVDDAGTAYVTWTVASEGSGSARPEDAIGFCRLPRGATACDNPPSTRLLVPQKTYGPADDPFQNQELSRGPMPLIVGDQLVILSTRYPTAYGLPGGGETDRATIEYVSLDGGTSFSGGAPAVAGANVLDEPVSFGTDASPRIGVLDSAEDGLGFRALAPGAFSGARALIAPEATPGERAQLTRLPNGGIAAIFVDGPGSIGIRRFSGQGDPADVASWSPKEQLEGYDPSIATGAGGRLLVSRKPFSDHGIYTVQQLAGPGAASKPVPLHPVGLDAARIQGSGGGVTALYVDAGGATDSAQGHTGLSTRRSAGGTTAFGAEQRLTTTPRDTFEPSFGTAPDGGGFAVWASGESGESQIRGHALGTLARSSGQGLPTTTPGSAPGDGGGVTADCRNRDFGKVRIQIETGCFLQGKRPVGKSVHSVAVSEGVILVNGLRITPIGKTQLVVDATSRQLYTSDGGQARVEIPSSETDPIVLWQGAIREDLQTGAKGRLFHFDTKQFPVKVKGFPVVGALQAYVDGAGSTVPVTLRLPTPFGDATADAVLQITPAGLRLDSLKLRAPDFVVPPVQVRDLRLSWMREGDRWEGGATIGIPGGAALKVAVVVANGKIVSIDATYVPPFPGISLYPNVFLHQVGLGVGFGPLSISGEARVGAIPVAPPLKVGESGTYVLDLIGALKATFGDPFKLHADGTLNVLGLLDVADAGFDFSTAGYTSFHAGIGIGVQPVAFIGVTADLQVGAKGFQGTGKGRVCALVGCLDLPQITASQKGIGACAQLPFLTFTGIEKLEGSATYRWGDTLPDIAEGCDLSSIEVFKSRQAGAPSSFAVPKGAPVLTINTRSADGAPAFDLITPSGTIIAPESGGDQTTTVADERTHQRQVRVPKPSSGTWRLVPRAGAPAIVRVTGSVPARAPKLRATLSRPSASGARTIRYSLDAIPDEAASFVERTAKGETPLAAAGRGGTVRFTPNPAVPGTHTILARIAQDGIVKHERTVARFTVARTVVRAPRSVRIRKAGRRLKVTFARDRGRAVRHLVEVRYGDGSRATALLPAGRTSTIVRRPRSGIVRPGRTTVRVRGISPTGKVGPTGRATLR